MNHPLSHRRMIHALTLSLVTVTPSLGTAGDQTPQTPSAPAAAPVPSEEIRRSILEVAKQYTDFRWTASPENIQHGLDENGTWVDTPDATFDQAGWQANGSENVGMPYSWGGFTTIEQFQQGLAAGQWAGNVPRSQDMGVSFRAMGLDCSGFVARAWSLPMKQSTRSLGGLCYELDDYADLKPGDIANKFDAHVVLVLGFTDETKTHLRVAEAARLRCEENVYPVETLKNSGFVPMRYKPLDARWVRMNLDQPRFASTRKGPPGQFEANDRSDALSEYNPYDLAEPSEWVRYRVPTYGDAGVRTMTFVARRNGSELELQRAFTVGADASGGELMSGATVDTEELLSQALLEFAQFLEPLRDMTVQGSQVESGSYRIAEEEWDAQRITLRYEGFQLTRSSRYPTVVEAKIIRSDEVPLLGILEADYSIAVDWSSRGAGVERRDKAFELEAYGKG